MQKWEYVQVHVKSSKGSVAASVNGEDVDNIKDEAGLMRYLNSLGAQGWEMENADRNEYGFQNYFFKRSVEE